MPRPFVFGHRGAMGHAPENTLISFETAWKMGADGIECDVHLSRDRRLVVIHDETLDRTTTGSGLVRDRTWTQLKRLRSGGWFSPRFKNQKLISLDDLLAWIQNKKTPSGSPLRLLLELKNEPARYSGLAEAVVACLKKRDALRRTLAFSFDHGVVKRCKILCPPLETGIIFSKPLPDVLARARWAKANGIFPRWSLVTPAIVRRVRAAGYFFGTWTVNEAPLMKKMARWGLDGITTNFPDRLLKVLGR